MSKKRKIWALIAMCMVYFFSYFHRLALPGTLFDELQADFAVSASAIAAMGAVFMYVYGAMQLFTGMLVDRYGGARILPIGGALMAFASLVFPWVHSLSWLYVMRALIGLGAGLIFISLVKELDYMFPPQNFAMILCVCLFVGYSGGLVGTWPLAVTAGRWGWRPVMFGVGILSVVAWVMSVVFLRGRRVTTQPPRLAELWRWVGVVFKNPDTWPIMIFGTVNFGVYFLWQTVLGKKMLTDIGGVAPDRAAAVSFLMMLVCMLSTSVSGFISRLIQNRRRPIIFGCAMLTMLALVLMAVAMWHSGGARWLEASLLLLGLTSSSAPIVCAAIKEVNPPESAGVAVGFSNTAAYLGVAIFSNLAGLVMDAFGGESASGGVKIYPRAAYFTVMIGCMMLAVWSCRMAWKVRETRSANVYGVPRA